MIRRLLPFTWLLALACAAYAAPPARDCTTPSSSFDLIQRGIFEAHNCTMSFCHGADRQGGLDLRAGKSYGSLIGSKDTSGDLDLVKPGRPDVSVLWLSLARKTLELANVSATAMPMDNPPISADELEGIRLWILAGAPKNRAVDRVADLISVCPEAVAEEQPLSELPTCAAGDPTLLLPNLVPDPPGNIRVDARNGKRRLSFTTKVGNTGDGPLIIQAAQTPAGPGHTVEALQVILRTDGSKCVHKVGYMRFSDGDGYAWQYGNWSDFELRRDGPTGELVAVSSKPAYCLVDSEALRPADGRPHQFQLDCTNPIGRMGISVGYKDTYHRVFPGQWIDLDTDPAVTIDRGTYYLTNIANPNGRLWEKGNQYGDNSNSTVIQLNLKDPVPAPASGAQNPEPTVRRPGPHSQPRAAHVPPARAPHTVSPPHQPRS